MAFQHTGGGDSGELCVVKRLDVLGAAVAHACPQAAEHLVDNLIERTLEGHAGGDAFGNELLGVGLVALEIDIDKIRRSLTYQKKPDHHREPLYP